MVDTCDPGRPVGQRAGHVVDREDHGAGTVGDRRTVMLAKRDSTCTAATAARRRSPSRPAPSYGLPPRVTEAAGCDLRHRPFVDDTGVEAGACGETGDGVHVRPQRGDGVRIELQRHHVGDRSAARLAVGEHEGRVALAGEQLQPRLVQSERTISLDVATRRSAARRRARRLRTTKLNGCPLM